MIKKVIKFGGTSLATPERMKQVAGIISQEASVIVVLSAIAGTTDALVGIVKLLNEGKKKQAINQIEKLREHHHSYAGGLFDEKSAQQLGRNIVDQHIDHIHALILDQFTLHEEKIILAQGELMSTALFQLYLKEQARDAELLSALDFMRIDKDLEPDNYYIHHNLVREIRAYGHTSCLITQGFICRNVYGEIDNLKRGGSDYTATLIGASLGVESIEIWTDIDGMHNNDPRVVEGTYSIEHLTYDEAAELAYFGAKILHPSSVLPAKQKGIPILLKNTLNPASKGTLIRSKSVGKKYTAIAAKDHITVIKIKSGRMLLAYGFLRRVFDVFERYKTPIDVIATSEVAVSLTIDDNTNIESIRKELAEFGQVAIEEDHTIICVVGNFSHDEKGNGILIFQSLANVPIRMVSYGGSDNNISLIVKSEYKNKALRSLNKTLFSANI